MAERPPKKKQYKILVPLDMWPWLLAEEKVEGRSKTIVGMAALALLRAAPVNDRSMAITWAAMLDSGARTWADFEEWAGLAEKDQRAAFHLMCQVATGALSVANEDDESPGSDHHIQGIVDFRRTTSRDTANIPSLYFVAVIVPSDLGCSTRAVILSIHPHG